MGIPRPGGRQIVCPFTPEAALGRISALPLMAALAIVVAVRPVEALQPRADKVAVSELRADIADGEVYVSFALTGAFTEEIHEEIEAGLTVTFKYELEVARRRPFWFDKTLARKTVTTSVTYDTLTHQYSLSKMVNDEVTETSVAVNESDMMLWMTRLDRVRMADPAVLEGVEEGSHYVRMKSRLKRRFVLLVFPSSTGTGWERVGLEAPGERAGAR